ncbi:MAG: hypothetical protein G01um101466_89 [Parcubacteria group bacterium Gr01-1014_66]|nr:MAG: hypothetical protein G01um101466_89 [Parcubacteria group bacterium Gr01-1014_66]
MSEQRKKRTVDGITIILKSVSVARTRERRSASWFLLSALRMSGVLTLSFLVAILHVALALHATEGHVLAVTATIERRPCMRVTPAHVSGETQTTPGDFCVVINEFVPNPHGNDNASLPEGEWVELYNRSNNAIDVNGWYLYDASDAHSIEITKARSDNNQNTQDEGETIVPAAGWLVVYLDGAYRGWLNNGEGDTVRVYNGPVASGILIDAYTYTTDAVSGKAFARIPDGDGQFVDPYPTPGRSNQLDASDGLGGRDTESADDDQEDIAPHIGSDQAPEHAQPLTIETSEVLTINLSITTSALDMREATSTDAGEKEIIPSYEMQQDKNDSDTKDANVIVIEGIKETVADDTDVINEDVEHSASGDALHIAENQSLIGEANQKTIGEDTEAAELNTEPDEKTTEEERVIVGEVEGEASTLDIDTGTTSDIPVAKENGETGEHPSVLPENIATP